MLQVASDGGNGESEQRGEDVGMERGERMRD